MSLRATWNIQRTDRATGAATAVDLVHPDIKVAVFRRVGHDGWFVSCQGAGVVCQRIEPAWPGHSTRDKAVTFVRGRLEAMLAALGEVEDGL